MDDYLFPDILCVTSIMIFRLRQEDTLIASKLLL